MKTKTTFLILSLFAAGCASPPEPPPAAWIPETGDLVVTSYCEKCPNQTAKEPIQTWLTDVRGGPGAWTVYADEFPKGIPSELVKPVWDHDPPPLPGARKRK